MLDSMESGRLEYRYNLGRTAAGECYMDEENTTFQGAIAMEETPAEQETPFDRLESRIDTLIEKYEQLVSVHSQCEEKMAGQEARIRELESELGNSEQQRSEIRTRLDALIDKLGRFS
ncbi:MAG: cell division protein ZapB [Syntrophobacteria bacterium]